MRAPRIRTNINNIFLAVIVCIMSLCIGACAQQDVKELPPPTPLKEDEHSEVQKEKPAEDHEESSEKEAASKTPETDRFETERDEAALRESPQSESEKMTEQTLPAPTEAKDNAEENKDTEDQGTKDKDLEDKEGRDQAATTANEKVDENLRSDVAASLEAKPDLAKDALPESVDDYSVSVDPPPDRPPQEGDGNAQEESGSPSELPAAQSKGPQIPASTSTGGSRAMVQQHDKRDAKEALEEAMNLSAEENAIDPESGEESETEASAGGDGDKEVGEFERKAEAFPGKGKRKDSTESDHLVNRSDSDLEVNLDPAGTGGGKGGIQGKGEGQGLIFQGKGRSVQWNLQRPPQKQ